MTSVHHFVFNDFQENTYILYDDTLECVIIDPGCYDPAERDELVDFISRHGLRPVRLINTHCHIDHVFGNKFVSENYGLSLEIHAGEQFVLDYTPKVAEMYGLHYEPSPRPGRYLTDGEVIHFGATALEAIYTPGHSPASLSFYCQKSQFVIAGDVLFYGSIGRTDLPGGDYQTLIDSIEQRLLPLGDEVKVYSGHGRETSIGHEKRHNPFLNE